MRRLGRDLPEQIPGIRWAAPWGSAGWNGTRAAPFTLPAALLAVSSGDTVVLWPGDYDISTGITVPSGVTITPMPGTHARLAGGTLEDGNMTVSADGGIVVHVEIDNDNIPLGETNPQSAAAIIASGGKLHYLVCRNGGNGLGWYTAAVPTEDYELGVYGCVTYGQYGGDNGEHSMYTQNDGTHWKQTTSCIFGQNRGWGWHAYTEEGALSKMKLLNTVAWGPGGDDTGGPGLLVGSPSVNPSDVIFDHCFVYGRNIQLNYGNRSSARLTITNCHGEELGGTDNGWTGSSANWTDRTITDTLEDDGVDAVYVLDATAAGESGRCHIVLFNTQGTADLEVDVSDYVPNGTIGYLYDGANPLRGAILRFVGPTVTLPLSALYHDTFLGGFSDQSHTSPDFAVFIVRTHGPDWTAPGTTTVTTPATMNRVYSPITRVGTELLAIDGMFITLTEGI